MNTSRNNSDGHKKDCVSTEEIPSWAQQQKIQSCGKNLDAKNFLNLKLCEKISIWNGNIVNLKVDAIVNATTEAYCGRYGVDGAIHSAAGPELRHECRVLRSCKTGEAKITQGYNLNAKFVIHTVGPLDGDIVDLKSCYENSLEVMLKNDLRTIAFPCISTGERGFPKEQAANVALMIARQFLEKNYTKVCRIIFCTYLPEDYQIYERLMWRHFPIKES